jgi:hypothetical protein
MKHTIRQNNQQIRKAQAVAMSIIYSTLQDAQNAWDAAQRSSRVETMPDVCSDSPEPFGDFGAIWEGRD